MLATSRQHDGHAAPQPESLRAPLPNALPFVLGLDSVVQCDTVVTVAHACCAQWIPHDVLRTCSLHAGVQCVYCLATVQQEQLIKVSIKDMFCAGHHRALGFLKEQKRGDHQHSH